MNQLGPKTLELTMIVIGIVLSMTTIKKTSQIKVE